MSELKQHIASAFDRDLEGIQAQIMKMGGLVEAAILAFCGQAIRLQAAGRTDAGVSALAQTVAFDAPEWLTPRALNAELPAEIRAWASADVMPPAACYCGAAEK